MPQRVLLQGEKEMFDKIFDKIIVKLAFPAVVATFLGVPLAVHYYDSVYLPSREPEGTKIFTLYWSGEKGITQKRINGWNYWQPDFERVKEITVHQGDKVLFRLISADVHHGFAMPAFGIPDVDGPNVDDAGLLHIKPGDVTRVEFVADKLSPPEGFKFFCTIMCGEKETHDKMSAILRVLPAKASQAQAAVSHLNADAVASNETNLDDISLTQSNGKEFQFKSLRGHVWVASFFFTSCASACGKMNEQIAKLQQEFRDQDVRFVSITCDPETDTPEILKIYSESFQADADRWIFLTGDMKKITQIGTGSFKVPLAQKTHSTRLILVDRNGKVRDTFKALEPSHITRLKKQLAELLDEGKEPPAGNSVITADTQTELSARLLHESH